ncbi:M64 family metallopeptidase, partial [Streptomyces sp. URMC 127]
MRRRISLAAGAAAVAAALAATLTPPASAANPDPHPAPDRPAASQRMQNVEYFTGPDGHPRHTTIPASPA